MTVSIGRIRPCPILDWRCVVLGHNLVRGAAGAAIQNAELLVRQGMVAGIAPPDSVQELAGLSACWMREILLILRFDARDYL